MNSIEWVLTFIGVATVTVLSGIGFLMVFGAVIRQFKDKDK